MAFAFQRIVCVVLAVFCAGASGAPAASAVTSYDQRQQGEYNLQVDLQDVAILFLPGSEFAQRNAFHGAGHAFKRTNFQNFLLGRHRNAVGLKKKHKNKLTEVTPATGYNDFVTSTEKPSAQVLPVGQLPAASIPSQGSSDAVKQIPKNGEHVSEDDPYSVTPSTQNFSEINALLEENGEVDDCYADEMVAVKIIEKPEVSTTTDIKTDSPETDDTKNVEIPTDSKTRTSSDDDGKAESKPINTVSSDSGEKQVASSDSKATEQKETNAKTENKSNEITTIKTTDRKSETAENANVTEPSLKKEDKPAETVAKKTTEIPTDTANSAESVRKSTVGGATIVTNPDTQDAKKAVVPTEMVAMKTVEKPADGKVASESAGKTGVGVANANKPDTQANTKKTNGSPVEMVAMRTVEKPTLAGGLPAGRNPGGADTAAVKAAVAAAVKAAVAAATTDTGVVVQSQAMAGKKPIEMVAVKKIDRPASGVASSGTPADTAALRPAEDAKITPAKTAAEETAVVSTEMVAVKTMENPATMATVLKSVLSVKAVIKPGTVPKTTHTLNGTSIMRKVGDRKPLPSIMLEVAPPKLVGEN